MRGITIEAADPQTLAAFWARAAGGQPAGGDSDVLLQTDAANGLRFHFHRSSKTPGGDQKTHHDLRVARGRRQPERAPDCDGV